MDHVNDVDPIGALSVDCISVVLHCVIYHRWSSFN